MNRLAALPMFHQVVAATAIAAARKARPTPSRWCIGSRSRALRPSARAAAPAVWASSIQAADSALATQPRKIMIGSVCGGDLRFLERPRLFRPLPPPLRPGPRPEGGMLLRVRGRPPAPDGRLRTAVPPCERAPPLGTRVAM